MWTVVCVDQSSMWTHVVDNIIMMFVVSVTSSLDILNVVYVKCKLKWIRSFREHSKLLAKDI